VDVIWDDILGEVDSNKDLEIYYDKLKYILGDDYNKYYNMLKEFGVEE
jgi:hypothetical protein